MATFELSLSKKVKTGKSEILVRCRISRDNEMRLKSGVYVIPALFVNGEIYTDVPALKKEMRTATAAINRYLAVIGNIIDVSIDAMRNEKFEGPLNKDWIERALSVKNINLAVASFNEIYDALRIKEEKEKLEQKTIEEEERVKNRKSFYQYAQEYCIIEGISPKRTDSYRTFLRLLMRFELFSQKVGNRPDFSVDYDTLTADDIEEFRSFVLYELDYQKDHPKIFVEICSIVDAALPVSTVKPIQNRGNNYVIDLLKKFSCVMKWLRMKGITTNDPFLTVKIGTCVYGRPIYLTKEERNELLLHDFKKKKLQLCRDIFVFQCLVGARYIDLSRLLPSNIVDGILEYIPSKTSKNSQQVQPRVPLIQPAIDILKKYEGVDVAGRILPFPSMTTYDDNIKEMFEECGITRNVVVRDSATGKEVTKPISEIAASHMARRTFAGNLWKQVKDPELVGSMTGHVPGSRSFLRYRDVDDDDRREAIELLK